MPGAKIAPTSRIFTHSQTGSLNASSKWRSTCIMADGRSRMVHPFLQVRRETSVPCLLCFVYQMDKVEFRIHHLLNTDINAARQLLILSMCVGIHWNFLLVALD